MSEEQAPYETKNLKQGTYVSRAAFSKLQGEKKRLEKDIYILCQQEDTYQRGLVLFHYREKYKKKEEFRALLKEAARKYIAENPDSIAGQISREHAERLKQLRELDNHPQL